LAEQLVARARSQGVALTGPGGLLTGLTKQVLETALEAELTEHLGHEHGETPDRRATSATGIRSRRYAPRSATCRSRCPGIGPDHSNR
jgi:putative transposase